MVRVTAKPPLFRSFIHGRGSLICLILLTIATFGRPLPITAFGETAQDQRFFDQQSGGGAPILIVVDADNPYGRYYAEILRTEGLNLFHVAELTSLSSDTLSNYDLIILSELSLTETHVDLFSNWVVAGGKLIAMRPDPLLEALAGLHRRGEILSDGYVAIAPTGPGIGIVQETIQYHGAADLFVVDDADILATLFSTASTATSYPAVILRSVGDKGGQVAVFAYDLARSIVYTRQGNPNWAGQERDATPPIRSNDLFYGNASFDPQPDWVNFGKIDIPQADEQQRFLVNLILTMTADKKPLPRLWYFPRDLRAVVVLTGDDHGTGDIVGRFERLKALSSPNCSVEDWECVRTTAYLWYDRSHLSDAQAAAYADEGFEIAMHIDTKCKDWTPASLRSDYSQQLGQFAGKYPSIAPPVTHRLHCIAWSDWATQAKVESEHGIRLDTNYYYYPPWTIKPGLFTGSGMPMRFADSDGQVINVFQATTQMNDNHDQSYPTTIDALLDKALGPEEYYGAFVANMHLGTGDFGAIHPQAEAIIASAQARGVPVISARQLLDWIDARENTQFEAIEWNEDALNFNLSALANARGLQVMLPYRFDKRYVSEVYAHGAPIEYVIKTIKGVQYAVFDGTTARYSVHYSPDTVSPIITDLTVVAMSEEAFAISWQTNENADATVFYGVSPTNLADSVIAPGFALAHQVNLLDLEPGTTHYYRVMSTDLAGNQSWFPPSDEAPLSFVMPIASVLDDTIEDFLAGDASTCIYVAGNANGELMLAPAIGEEFRGTELPLGWTSEVSTDGVLVVNEGQLQLERSRVWSEVTYSAGHSLEFLATFERVPNQHIGFSNSPTFDPPYNWIIFSTGWRGDGVYVRVGSSITKLIGSALLGEPHRYRIDWDESEARFYVDDVLVFSTQVTVEDERYLVMSSATAENAELVVDWVRMGPYTTSCQFVSRTIDVQASVCWRSAFWEMDAPRGTSIGLEYRLGFQDGTWSPFLLLPLNPAPISKEARYIQYRLLLDRFSSDQTPSLHQIGFSFSPNDSGLCETHLYFPLVAIP